jgi:hypothetical protein
VPTAPNLLEQVKLMEGRGSSHLDLQEVIATNALVVHLMVRVVCVATALVLDKGEAVRLAAAACGGLGGYLQPARGGARGGDIAADEAAIAGRLLDSA